MVLISKWGKIQPEIQSFGCEQDVGRKPLDALRADITVDPLVARSAMCNVYNFM